MPADATKGTTMRGMSTSALPGVRSTLREPPVVDQHVEFRIVGPLGVVPAAGALHIGGSRQRITLAMLLTDVGRVVSVERLVAAVWGARPPATARTQIAICISALRRILAE